MAAGLGFKDFQTGEVLTAADVDGYLMQGVWVFASAAARDAAVTSPQEGNFAYLKDTNTTTYYTGSAWTNLDTTGMVNPMTTTGDTIYSSSGSTPARLGIGSTGQVLTVSGGVPSWATPAGGGGMTLLSTTTLSGNSTTISSISGSYKTLYVIGRGIYTSSADGITLRVNSDSGANYTDYYYVFVSSSGLGNGRNTSSTGISCGDTGSSSSAANYTMFDMKIDRYAETEVKQINTHAVGFQGSVTVNRFTNTVYSPTTAISSITFLTTSGGGITFSGGTIYVYGVN